jgi:hypothetical protein
MSRQPAGRREAATRILRPMYDAALGDSVREGRLRLDGTRPVERQMAVVGLVGLFGMLASVALASRWRAGPLLPLNAPSGTTEFVPSALFPVTLLAFAVAWLLCLWGAALASLPLRIAGAVAFLLLTGSLGRPPAVSVGGSLALRWGPTVARVGYLAVPAILLLFTLARRRKGLEAWLRPVALLLIVLAVVAVFGSQLLIYRAQQAQGLPVYGPELLSQLVFQVQNLLIPLVLLSGVAVIEFSYRVAEAAAITAWRLSGIVARVALAALVAVKLWIELLPVEQWVDYVQARPAAVVRVLLSLASFGGVAVLLHGTTRDRPSAEDAKERLVFGSAFLLAAPFLFNLLVVSFFSFLLAQFDVFWLAKVEANWPFTGVVNWGSLVLWTAVLILGVYLVVRSRERPLAREAGIAMVLVGTWVIPQFVLSLLDLRPGFRDAFLDLAVTLLVAGYLLARWRHVSGAIAVRLGALVIFSWLVLTKADFIAGLGSLLRLPSVIVVVVGALFSLAADSAFASGDSKFFPRVSRPLLWVGFLLLSATILNWFQVTHGSDLSSNFTDLGFFLLGIPVAVWFLLRHPFEAPVTPSAEPSATPEPAPE